MSDYTPRDLREAWIDYRTGDEAFDEYKDYVAANAAFDQAMAQHAKEVLLAAAKEFDMDDLAAVHFIASDGVPSVGMRTNSDAREKVAAWLTSRAEAQA